MKKLISILYISLTGLSPLLAQQQETEAENSTFRDRIFLGGNFGLQFGNYTFIDISPLVGYRINNRLSAGPGITYRFLKIRGFEPSSTYGGKIFARHTVGRQFFVHTEYESLNTEILEFSSGFGEWRRSWVPGFFLGGGIIQPVGQRAAVVIYGLYNFLHIDGRSPYQSPWVFNVGFTI